MLKNIIFSNELNLLLESNKNAAISKSKSAPLFATSHPAPNITFLSPGFFFVKSNISFFVNLVQDLMLSFDYLNYYLFSQNLNLN